MRAYFLDGSLRGQVKDIQQGDVYHVALPLSMEEVTVSREDYVPISFGSFKTEDYHPRFSDGHVTFYSVNENFSGYLINMFTVIEEQKKEIEQLRYAVPTTIYGRSLSNIADLIRREETLYPRATFLNRIVLTRGK